MLASRVFSYDSDADVRGSRYLRKRRSEFEKRFGSILGKQLPNDRWRALVLALIIVEDFNRPRIARAFETLAHKFGLARTLGIMQVTTDKAVSDGESIALGIKHLMASYQKAAARGDWRQGAHASNWDPEIRMQYEERALIHSTLVLYNASGDYARDVEAIFDKLLEERPTEAGMFLHPDATARASSNDVSATKIDPSVDGSPPSKSGEP